MEELGRLPAGVCAWKKRRKGERVPDKEEGSDRSSTTVDHAKYDGKDAEDDGSGEWQMSRNSEAEKEVVLWWTAREGESLGQVGSCNWSVGETLCDSPPYSVLR